MAFIETREAGAPCCRSRYALSRRCWRFVAPFGGEWERGHRPPCPHIRQREKALLTQTQSTQKGCVFACPIRVRFLHRIKERCCRQPRSESQRPAMRGAVRVCGLEIRCGLGGRSASLFDFRWSLHTETSVFAQRFAVLSGAVREYLSHGRLQKRLFPSYPFTRLVDLSVPLCYAFCRQSSTNRYLGA